MDEVKKYLWEPGTVEEVVVPPEFEIPDAEPEEYREPHE